MPLANALLTEKQLDDPEETFPLEIAFCSACSLVQLTKSVSPEKLFREYVYFSSFSDTMLQHAEELSTQLIGSKHLDATSLVLEVASNMAISCKITNAWASGYLVSNLPSILPRSPSNAASEQYVISSATT